MRFLGECRQRRWRGVFGLAFTGVAFSLTGCGSGGSDGPVAEPVSDYQPPDRAQELETTVIANHGPAETLRVRTHLPANGARLLFMEGRSATRTDEDGSAWVDPDGRRVVVFDPRGRVERIIQGESFPTGIDPWLAKVDSEGGWLFSMDGSGHPLPPTSPAGPVVPPAPVTGADGSRIGASRSPVFHPLAPVRPDMPLLWVAPSPEEPFKPMGRVRSASEPLLGHLENSGWNVPTPDGGAYFAWALEPRLSRFDAEGTLLWESSWVPERSVATPRLEAVDGTARAAFDIVHHGLALGPDGRTYILGPVTEDGTRHRILVFEDDGELKRWGTAPREHGIFVDRRGAVYAVSVEDALSGSATGQRSAFEPFRLPSLEGDDTIALEDHRGKVVVVNFWASWCPPCRREIPALDSLRAELDPSEAEVIGLNVDRIAGQGISFLAELGGVEFPNAQGDEGDLRHRYGYRGLPYTVILDRDHRVVQSLYGFGSSVEPIRQVVLEELGR